VRGQETLAQLGAGYVRGRETLAQLGARYVRGQETLAQLAKIILPLPSREGVGVREFFFPL